MELFSELYGRYYSVVASVLETASHRTITAKEINDVIIKQGFSESLLGLSPKLLETGAENYNLLIKDNSYYRSVLKYGPSKVLTTNQKMWLKALLSDPRIRLFLSKSDISELDAAMFDVKPLYDESFIKAIDVSTDGDNFENVDYIRHFQIVLSAVRDKKCLEINYRNAEGKRMQCDFAPYRLEYSLKDDKFRLTGVKLERGKIKVYSGKIKVYSRINLSRIERIVLIDTFPYPSGVEKFISGHKMPEPIEIEVSNERNGFERCFIHLSNFERSSEYIRENNTCRIKIYYYDFDESELIITLLSFGPILKVIGPESFKKQIVERIKKQIQLLCDIQHQ